MKNMRIKWVPVVRQIGILVKHRYQCTLIDLFSSSSWYCYPWVSFTTSLSWWRVLISVNVV